VPETSRRTKTKLCTVVGNITGVKKAAARHVFDTKFRRKTAQRRNISGSMIFS